MSHAHVCPECHHRLVDGAVLCTNCGHDLRTHRRLAASVLEAGTSAMKVLGPARRLFPWLLGLGLAALLIGSLIAALLQPTFATWYVGIAALYILTGWIAGAIADFRTKGLVGALMWLLPFAGRKCLLLFGVAGEYTTTRIRDHGPIFEAIFINAVLALLSLLTLIVIRLI